MRTVLTTDDEVAAALGARTQTSGSSHKAVDNEVMRGRLMTGTKAAPERAPFRILSAPRGCLPGIDPLKLNQLVDELETEGFLERPHGEGPS